MQDQELEAYFTAIKEDFNGVHDRFDKVEDRLGKVEDRLGRVEDRLGRIENNLGRVENVCFSILEVVRGQDFKFQEFNHRLVRLEQKAF